MTALAGRVFWVSLSTSVVLLPLLLLAGPICRRYRAKSCYVLWLLLALRLLIPVEIPLPQAPVTVEVPVVEFAVLETPQTGVEIPVQTQTNPTVFQPSPMRRDVSPVEILGLIWAAGVVLLLAAQWINYSTLKQRLWNHSQGNSEDQQQLAQLGAAVPVLRGDVESPMTFGLFHPAIFLPRELPQEDTPMVLRHELCHLRRRDLWYKALLLLCACIHWFNPLVWKLGQVAGEHLELCCDEDVVAGQNVRFRKEYGQLLLRSAAAGQQAVFATQFGGSDLKGRIMNLFTEKKRGGALVCAVTCAALMMGSLVGCEVRAVEHQEEKPSSSVEVAKPTGEVVVNDSAAMLEVMLNSQLGAALPEIDYAGETLVVFHDYWGLAVYDRAQQGFVRVADTASLGMNRMQGSQYTEVTMGADLNTIRLENIPNSDGTVWYYQIKEDQFVQGEDSDFQAASNSLTLTAEELKAFVDFVPNGGQTNVCRALDNKLVYLEIPEEGAVTIGDLQLVEMERTGDTQRRVLRANGTSGEEAPLLWPVEGEYTLSALYGTRTHPVTGAVNSHNGIDIVADGGTEIQAVQSGVVTESAFDKQYGNYVLIAHEGGVSTLYAQMKECLVEENDTVTQGQVIGTVGKTGMATGEHLHFEIYQDGARLDPVNQYSDLTFQVRSGNDAAALEK